MARGSGTRTVQVGLALASLALCFAPMEFAVSRAATIPAVRHFTSADGLVSDQAWRVLIDRDRFVWVAATHGLSLFDGERFATVPLPQPVAGATVSDIAQAPDGAIWVATSAGLLRIDPTRTLEQGRAIERVPLDSPEPYRGVHRVLAAPDGGVWAGTYRELVKVERTATGWQATRADLRVAGVPIESTTRIQALALSPSGDLWAGTHGSGIFRIGADGTTEQIPGTETGADFVRGIVFDADGRTWTAFLGGVARWLPAAAGKSRHADLVLGVHDGLPSYDPTALRITADGKLLIASTAGVTVVARGADARWRIEETLSRAAGLPSDDVTDLAIDGEGNLWLALRDRGLVRWAASGFVTQAELDRPGFRIVTLFENADGTPSVLSQSGRAQMVIWELTGNRFVPQPVKLPAGVDYLGWFVGRNVLQRRDRSWWVTAGNGLVSWSGSRRGGAAALSQPPSAWLRSGRELPDGEAIFLAEDSRGVLWGGFRTASTIHRGLARMLPGAHAFEAVAPDAFAGAQGPIATAEAGDGSTWVLFFGSRLFRLANDQVDEFTTPELMAARLGGLAADRSGRVLLLGDGVFVIREPAAAVPPIEPLALPTEQGPLTVHCAVDDTDGKLWFGTQRGVLRLDESTGATRLFTTADGLPGNVIQLCLRDRAGRLWFSDLARLARRDPQPDRPPSIPPARLRAIRVAGEQIELPPLGSTAVGPLVVPAGRSPIAIEFFAPSTETGAALRFEHRLDESSEWQPISEGHAVHLARLAPGRYRFEVRATSQDRRLVGTVASLDLDVLAPLWRRGWFLALCAAALCATIYATYRVRLARLLALERIRTRIATDLHDDIGSSLSQISILAQLARRQVIRGDAPAGEGSLERIVELAGETVEAMSDVVWAISPRGDRLDQLVSRMRRFATELFSGSPIELSLDLPAIEAHAEALDPHSRRQIYLIFKEALRNALRHSGARRVEVSLRSEGSRMTLTIQDDGRGLDLGDTDRGHGLASIRRRAQAIGAELAIAPSPQGGVRLVLESGPRALSGPPSE